MPDRKPTWVKQSVWDALDEAARKKTASRGPENIGEWDEEIAGLPEADLLKYSAALRAIREWGAFDLAFKWTRVFVLIDSISYEMERRERTVKERKK